MSNKPVAPAQQPPVCQACTGANWSGMYPPTHTCGSVQAAGSVIGLPNGTQIAFHPTIQEMATDFMEANKGLMQDLAKAEASECRCQELIKGHDSDCAFIKAKGEQV